MEKTLAGTRTVTAIGTQFLTQPVEPRNVEAVAPAAGDSSEESPVKPVASLERIPTPGGSEQTTPGTSQEGDSASPGESLASPSSAVESSSDSSNTSEATMPSKRVVNEFFEIRESATGGLGSFARKDLKYGDHILLESPIVRTIYFDLIRDVEKLDAGRKAAFMSLHPYHEDPRVPLIERIWNANAYRPPRPPRWLLR